MPKKSEAKAEEPKKKSNAKVVKINPGELDEVFFQSNEPYENFAVYVQHGKYNVGDTVDEADLVPPSVVQGNLEPAVG